MSQADNCEKLTNLPMSNSYADLQNINAHIKCGKIH